MQAVWRALLIPPTESAPQVSNVGRFRLYAPHPALPRPRAIFCENGSSSRTVAKIDQLSTLVNPRSCMVPMLAWISRLADTVWTLTRAARKDNRELNFDRAACPLDGLGAGSLPRRRGRGPLKLRQLDIRLCSRSGCAEESQGPHARRANRRPSSSLRARSGRRYKPASPRRERDLGASRTRYSSLFAFNLIAGPPPALCRTNRFALRQPQGQAPILRHGLRRFLRPAP
jgi:hypothetical protein